MNDLEKLQRKFDSLVHFLHLHVGQCVICYGEGFVVEDYDWKSDCKNCKGHGFTVVNKPGEEEEDDT